jgi:hypothetical protein
MVYEPLFAAAVNKSPIVGVEAICLLDNQVMIWRQWIDPS